jgi:NAD(P)-dependent dehydrogenase (short-subunit alcohol dehydrogenase family)
VLLKDRVVVVTGGGRGIGRAVALAAAAEGANVVVADIDVSLAGDQPVAPASEAVVDEIERRGGQSVAVHASVTTMAGASQIVQTAIDTWGHIDGVVCSAGIARHLPFLDLTEDDWDAVVDTHLKGHFTVFRAASEAMATQRGGGSLVGLTSGYVQGSPRRASYRSAKAGIIALVKCAAIDLAGHGIRVNCIGPAANTRMTENEAVEVEGEPGDVAPLATYFLSDLSEGVTGEVVSIAGDRVAGWREPYQDRLARRPGGWSAEAIAAEMPYLLGLDRVGLGRGVTMPS